MNFNSSKSFSKPARLEPSMQFSEYKKIPETFKQTSFHRQKMRIIKLSTYCENQKHIVTTSWANYQLKRPGIL